MKSIKQKNNEKIWKAAFYIRLSKEDVEKTESESVSIANQREILKEYLNIHPDIEYAETYTDDGWSGTSFDRPGWKKLMEDVYRGKINCIIVKDLSRFGRNYIDGGKLLDDSFVRMNVRFIAVNNGIDTFSGNMNAATQCISIGVTNVINESVAATTSVNIRATLNCNRQQGKFIGSFPSYGYLKDPEDHHRLIPDDEAAAVVKKIYFKFISGESIVGITKYLNAGGIPNPTKYKQLKGFNYRRSSSEINDGLWQESSVRRILKNEIYTGNMVQGRRTTYSYKIRKLKDVPKEDWFIVENTHEAIIDKDTFCKVQSLFERNIRVSPETKKADLFSGFVKCADCGRAMSKKTNRHSYGVYSYYRCTTAKKMAGGVCTNHTVRIDRLEEAVLVYLNTMIAVACEADEIIKKLETESDSCSRQENLKTAVSLQKKEREKYMHMLTDLYPDWKSGVISGEEYIRIKRSLNEKIENSDKAIKALEEEGKNKNEESRQNAFIENFRKYGKIEKLTRGMLIELVDKILVHEDGGITIKIKYRDEFSAMAEYIEKNKNGNLNLPA